MRIKILRQILFATALSPFANAHCSLRSQLKGLHGGAVFTVLFSIFLALSAFSLSSCLPQISVGAGNKESVTIFFSTGFSDATAKILKNLSGIEASESLFNKNDVLSLLKSAGAENVSANIPNQNEIAVSGTMPQLLENPLSKIGMIQKTEKSLKLTIGRKQIVDFYSLLSDEAKSYLDLMMIPALIGEKMSVSEYRELLSSMYGPSFSNEIIDGKLTIVLYSPNGKKKSKETVTLGELLCSEEKTWILDF